jgi:simple sugar transport system permease protein
VTGRLFEQFSGGQGYTAIAVALVARLHPIGVAAAALFFGALAAGSGAMQRVAGVSAVFVAVVQATTILALLALDVPRAAPQPRSETAGEGVA